MFGFTGRVLARAAIFALLLAAPAPGALAEAIEDEKGFHLGLKLMGSSLHADNLAGDEFFIKDDGGGVQLDIGYRFNRTFMLELSFGGAGHSTSVPAIDAQFVEGLLLGYYRFSPLRAFRPFLKGGFGGYSLTIEEGAASARIEGGGIALGGGFRYFFSPHFSAGLDLTHNIIKYDTAGIDVGGFTYEWEIDEDGAETSLGLAFGYSF